MNVIFLDIDGVFVTQRSWLGTKKKKSGRASEFDPIAMEMIRKLCERTNSKIVISSTWRKISVLESGKEPKNQLFNQFKSAGLLKYIVQPAWRTPCLASIKRPENYPSYNEWKRWSDCSHCIRGDEINRWLEFNGKDVKNYCIIDDDTDFTDDQIKNNFVNTDMEEGFLYRHFKKAEKILTKNP